MCSRSQPHHVQQVSTGPTTILTPGTISACLLRLDQWRQQPWVRAQEMHAMLFDLLPLWKSLESVCAEQPACTRKPGVSKPHVPTLEVMWLDSFSQAPASLREQDLPWHSIFMEG